MKAGRRSLVALCALAALVLPAHALAARRPPRPKSEVQPARTEGIAYLGRDHGYDLFLRFPEQHIAELGVERIGEEEEGLNVATTRYVSRLRGSLLRGRVSARFPGVGLLSLRFDPGGKRRLSKHQKACRGPETVTEAGWLRGRIKASGEAGFFQLSSTRAHIALMRWGRLVCRPGHAQLGDHEVGSPPLDYAEPSFGFTISSGRGAPALLVAAARRPRGYVESLAYLTEGEPGASVQVGSVEMVHGLAIGRSALGEGPVPGTLLTSLPGAHPASASLAPPEPFYGQGEYLEKTRKSHAWTGTLGVHFPGLDMSLAGPAWYSSLCVVSPLIAPYGCNVLKPRPLEPDRDVQPGARWSW